MMSDHRSNIVLEKKQVKKRGMVFKPFIKPFIWSEKDFNNTIINFSIPFHLYWATLQMNEPFNK